MNFAALQYGEAFPDNGETSSVRVAKWFRPRPPRSLVLDEFAGVTSLLYRNLCDTGQWFAVLLQECGIADDENFRVTVHRQVRLYFHPASPVRIRF
jgi:hypothetical protein